MIKPTVLMVWPRHLDFPIARYNLERFKDNFESIWIAFSNHHQEDDYTNFIRAQMPFANFIDAQRVGIDWRNDAINQLLDIISVGSHVLFLEQDFLIKDQEFFDIVLKDFNFVKYLELERVHPAFALVRKELIRETSRDFSPWPPADHFKKFFDEIPDPGIELTELDLISKKDYYHMAGLSQNYLSYTYGDQFYRPNNFLYFNYRSIGLPIKHHHKFLQIQKAIDRKFGHPKKHQFLEPFFPEEKE